MDGDVTLRRTARRRGAAPPLTPLRALTACRARGAPPVQAGGRDGWVFCWPAFTYLGTLALFLYFESGGAVARKTTHAPPMSSTSSRCWWACAHAGRHGGIPPGTTPTAGEAAPRYSNDKQRSALLPAPDIASSQHRLAAHRQAHAAHTATSILPTRTLLLLRPLGRKLGRHQVGRDRADLNRTSGLSGLSSSSGGSCACWQPRALPVRTWRAGGRRAPSMLAARGQRQICNGASPVICCLPDAQTNMSVPRHYHQRLFTYPPPPDTRLRLPRSHSSRALAARSPLSLACNSSTAACLAPRIAIRGTAIYHRAGAARLNLPALFLYAGRRFVRRWLPALLLFAPRRPSLALTGIWLTRWRHLCVRHH